MSRARTIGTAPAASPILPSASFGASNYQQDTTASIAALATALGGLTVTGGVTPYTYAWTVDGATTGLDDATAANPALTVTSLAGLEAGRHPVRCTVTDAASNTATADGWVEIGDEDGFITSWDHDYSADSAYDWSTGSQDLDGVTHSAAAITGGSTLNTVNGTGIVAVSAGGGAPTIFIDIPDLYAGLGLDRHTPIRFWRRLNDNAFTVNSQRNIHGVRADAGAKWLAYFNEHISGVTGGRAARYVGGDQTTPGIGHWTVTCIEIIDTTVRLWYSTAAWSGDWPALSSMTVYTANGKEALTAYDQNSTSAVGFSIFTDGQFYVFDAELGATCRLVQARAQFRG